MTIKSNPARPKSGGKVDLTCESASSNPPAQVIWWRDGLQLINDQITIVNSTYGGKSTRASIRLNVTNTDHGTVYVCQASNKIMQQSVHDAITLNVRRKLILSLNCNLVHHHHHHHYRK